MADITTGVASLSLEDNLRHAVCVFVDSQRDFNRKWLQRQFHTPEDGTPHEPKLDADLEAVAKARLRAKTSSIQHRLASYEQASLGQIVVHGARNTPVDPYRRATFLAELTATVSQELDQSVPNYRPQALPKDYIALLSITDGLRDSGLRDEVVCGIDGIARGKINNMTANDVEKISGANRLWRQGWQLHLGFVLGRGDLAYSNWLLYYYCARREVVERYDYYAKLVKLPRTVYGPDDVIHDHEKKWKWRLFYQEKPRFQHSFLRPMVFAGIVEWLEFYQNWYQRETVDYVAWEKRMIEGVRMLYPEEHSDAHDPFEDGDICFNTLENI